MQAAAKLGTVPEDGSDLYSQDSRISKPIEELVGAKWGDPRKKLAQKQMAKIPENTGGLSEEALQAHNAKLKVNEQFYRQPEAVIPAQGLLAPSHFEFDKSLDRFFRSFCKALVEEAASGPRPTEVERYVDRYGREAPGFLRYAEFKEIYSTHAHPMIDPKAPPPEEGKLVALFNVFDTHSQGKIARMDFVSTVTRSAPALPLIERLGSKVKKGGERLIRALKEEFQEADAPFGCNGQLPLNNFQVIMTDYDMPLLQADLADLEKRGFVHKDELDCKYVDYAGILSQVGPKARGIAGQPAQLTRAVIRL